MIRHLVTLLALPLLLWAPGCVYDLDVEGKQCDTSSHICPSGYYCSRDGGTGVCKVGTKTDGGGEDAGDRPNCTGDETDCADIDTLLQCDLGSWVQVPCDSGKYCTDFGNTQNAACVDDCNSSADCPSGYYCDPDSHCALQGECDEGPDPRCNSTRDKVIRCDEESLEEVLVKTCTAGVQYCDTSLDDCRNYCDTDNDCFSWPDESCNRSSRMCERIFLCDSNAWCTSGSDAPIWITNKCTGGVCECTEGVCVIKPTEQATAGTGMDVSCYPDATTAPGTPATCNLEGSVVSFANATRITYNQYIEVHIHTLGNVLDGDISNSIASMTVTDDGGNSKYSLSDLPTNTELVMDVHCNDQGGSACTLHPMYTFVIYLRADDCQAEGGTIDFSAPAIDNSLWQAYSTAGGTTSADPTMGLAFGRLRDCVAAGGNAILKGTGDISMSYHQFGDNLSVFYLPFGGPPQASDVSTLGLGFFGAANALPIRGLAAAMIKDGTDLVWLRTYPFRVFPQAASLVLFDKPKIPR